MAGIGVGMGIGIALVLSLLAPPSAHQTRAKAISTMNEGVALIGADDYAKGEAKLVEATTIDPGYAQAWLNLGVLRDRREQLEPAIEAFREGVRVAEGELAVELRYRLGVAVLQQSERSSPSRAERNSKVAEALSLLQKVTRDEPWRARAHLHVARCFEKLDRPAQADAAYRKAIEANPRLDDAYEGLGLLYIDHGFASLGIAVLETSTTVNEQSAGAWVGLGRGMAKLERFDDAVDAYERARKLAPHDLEVLFGLGMAHAELNHRKQAVEALEAFLKRAGSETPEHIRMAARNTAARMQDVL